MLREGVATTNVCSHFIDELQPDPRKTISVSISTLSTTWSCLNKSKAGVSHRHHPYSSHRRGVLQTSEEASCACSETSLVVLLGQHTVPVRMIQMPLCTNQASGRLIAWFTD